MDLQAIVEELQRIERAIDGIYVIDGWVHGKDEAIAYCFELRRKLDAEWLRVRLEQEAVAKQGGKGV